ncbi:MAG: hypothetical protein D6694_03975 [Gammaproteobacteria bacterium]|nr:MAG: hypothetical protein D6694_03975 [Gammaproteobacteria bacterium]
MELILIVVGIIAIFFLYFAFGAIIKFIVGWFPSIFGIVIGVVIGFLGGWTGAVAALFIITLSIVLTDSWHNSPLYLRIEKYIDKKFYFGD